MLTYGWKTGSLYCAMPEAGATNTLSYYQRNMVGPDEDSSSTSGPSCSKLTTSLVNVSLKFQTLISQISRYFLFKKCEKLLHCKSFSQFFNKKFQCIWL